MLINKKKQLFYLFSCSHTNAAVLNSPGWVSSWTCMRSVGCIWFHTYDTQHIRRDLSHNQIRIKAVGVFLLITTDMSLQSAFNQGWVSQQKQKCPGLHMFHISGRDQLKCSSHYPSYRFHEKGDIRRSPHTPRKENAKPEVDDTEWIDASIFLGFNWRRKCCSPDHTYLSYALQTKHTHTHNTVCIMLLAILASYIFEFHS